MIANKAAGVSADSTLGTLATKSFNGVSGAGNLFDGQGGKHVAITSEGDDSATIFVVAGTDREGNNISEEINGGAADVTVVTFNEFKTVSSITVKGQATQGIIDVGYMNPVFNPGGWKSPSIGPSPSRPERPTLDEGGCTPPERRGPSARPPCSPRT